jgi:DNA-binding NtrC family response regulator
MDFPQRVLIVDDDPIQRAVLEQIFTTHGSSDVETGADGHDAISIIENSMGPFDLIVLDLVMPEYDGIRLISYLEGQNVKTRLLLLSGLPRDVVRMSNTLAEASGLTSIGCLQKPLHLESLLEIVHGQRWPRGKAPKPEADRAVQPERTWHDLHTRMTTA